MGINERCEIYNKFINYVFENYGPDHDDIKDELFDHFYFITDYLNPRYKFTPKLIEYANEIKRDYPKEWMVISNYVLINKLVN